MDHLLIVSYFHRHPVITSSPSEDHTYSAGNEDEADKLNGSVGSVNGMKCHEGDERA